MPYIPEHRFTGNLYTSGNEFVILKTKKPYQGNYHKLSSGKFFTESTPYVNITQEIIPIESLSPVSSADGQSFVTLGGLGYPNDNITENYFRLFEVDKDLVYKIPKSFSPEPTAQDYINGTFIRYFLYNTVTQNYLEVDQNTYNNINKKNPEWDYFNYKAFTIPWKISGTKKEIIKTNTKLITVVSRSNNLASLSSYLVDLCEYSQVDLDEDPFTYTITYNNL